MSVNHINILTTARGLSSDESKTESDLRSAVSRAYYSAFHCAKELLEKFGIKFSKGGGVHDKIISILENCNGIDDSKKAGSMLRDLKGDRNDADYNLTDTKFSKLSNAELRISTANDICDLIGECEANQYNHMMNSARDYARTTLQLGLKPVK